MTRSFALAFGSAFLLSGCFTPLQGSAQDRAISLYHEAQVERGALAFRPEARGPSEARKRAVSGTLGVDEAIRLAKESSARLAELSARVEAAKAAADAKDRYRNPELRISQIKLDDIVSGKPAVRPALRFRPSRPGEVDAEIAEARADEAAARAALSAAELALEADIRWLFEDVLLLDAEIAAADAVAEARRSLSARMKERLDAAVATALEEGMADLSAVEAEQDGAELAAKRVAARGLLLDAIGLDPGADVKLAGESPIAWAPAKLPPEKTLVEEALRHDPKIAAASAKMDAETARISIERGKRYPWLTFVELGYDFAPNTQPGLGFRVQAGVDLPLFDTNKNGVRASEAALSAETRALAAEVERVVRDVRARLREARAAEELVESYRARALPVAERAAAASKQALEGRGIDVVRALVVDERRVLVELRLLRIVRRYRVALAELGRVVGGHLPAGP